MRNSKKQLDRESKFYALVNRIIVVFTGGLGIIAGILDWPLERKILILTIISMVWLFLRFHVWGWKGSKHSRKKLSQLLSLYIGIEKNLHPEFKNILLRAIIPPAINLALIAMLLSISLGILLGFMELSIRIYIANLTPTPTQIPTLTFTPSPTITLTATRVPAARSLYYLFILDASSRMTDGFGALETKWLDMQSKTMNRLIEDLTERANYGLILLGGNQANGTKTCSTETQMAVEFAFDNQKDIIRTIEGVKPEGVASLGSGISLARDELLNLPENVHKELFLFLGGGDDCDPDKWRRVLNFLEYYKSSLSDVHTELVLMADETIDPEVIRDLNAKVETLGLEQLVGIRAPTTSEELQDVLSQIQEESLERSVSFEPTAVAVQKTANAERSIILPTNMLVQSSVTPPQVAATASPTFTKTNLPTITPTPSKSAAPSLTLAPSKTPTRTATLIPSDTPSPEQPTPILPTSTPTPTHTAIAALPSSTPTPGPFDCPSSRTSLNTASFGGVVTITAPQNCEAGFPPQEEFETNGTYSDISDKIIWVLVYPPNQLYYPQSPDACATPAPPPQINYINSSWKVDTYLGTPGEGPKPFDIVVVLVDEEASEFLSDWVHRGCETGDYLGISQSELETYNITEKYAITVQTR